MRTTPNNTAYLESRILSADPIELVAILYEQAIVRVGEARRSLAEGDIAERSARISKAIAIVSELDKSLNHESGGEISQNLARLYHYMRERLFEANLKQQDAPMADVEKLLNTLAEAWDGVKSTHHAAAQMTNVVPMPAPVAEPVIPTAFFPGAESYQSAHAWTA